MAKQTGHLLRQLRSLMRSKHLLSEAIQAYIIPSEDAHQVNYSKLKFKSLRIKINDKNFEWRFDDSLIIFKF